MTTAATTYVYDFASGSMHMKELLGGKGANLCEMTRLGLPVPPGFIVTTEACRHYLRHGREPQELANQIAEKLAALEAATGRALGDPDDPMLVSVRSGGKFSMPGMMETILNIGLTDTSVHGLAKHSGDWFAWDCYRRLIGMFARTVHGVNDFPHADIDADPAEEAAKFKRIYAERVGHDFPQNPDVQLHQAVVAVFQSWRSERAGLYRRQEHIPDDLGTAVNVMAMVFGNLDERSGTGVAFTRDPATGAKGVYGDYLPHAQGEDVVAGIRNTLPLQELAQLDPDCFAELMSHMDALEYHYRDLCDIEFTIERGRLWMLQTRVGKRTAAAAFTIACQLVDEGLITLDDALQRVTGHQLARLMFPTFEPGHDATPIAQGVPASPGAAVGAVVFDAHRAAAMTVPAILVRRETNPDDLPGIVAAQGTLTSRGGKTSHAAVVARGLGKTCVCGADSLDIDLDARQFTVGEVVVREGDIISIDGTTGEVYLGELPVAASPLVRHLESGDDSAADTVVRTVTRLLRHADSRAKLQVRANADTPADAQLARRFGATGIGLCRTEHMFLGTRRILIEKLILADTDAQRDAVLDELLPLQRDDFTAILTAMDGLPVIIRLLDPPLHEFLAPLEELAVQVATGRAGDHEVRLYHAAKRMHEQNPMLGLRGARLGLMIPQLYATQARAIAQAAAACRKRGGDPRPEIMVPLIGSVHELQHAQHIISEETDLPIGTMIEVPRAALRAGQIARHAGFFSFGTNDLTQLTWGYSRDDVEASFFPRYLQLGIFDTAPFETLDRSGVGRLVALAVDEARQAKPDLSIGVCGEHGGDPESVHFFAQTGLDYVSCSPYRIPVARLEAGRAAISQRS